jgi:Protein of unknown function (DUF3422)
MIDFSNERPGYEILPPAIARHVVFRLAMKENPRFSAQGKDPGEDGKSSNGDGKKDEPWRALCDCLANHINDLRRAYRVSRPIKIVPPHQDSNILDLRFSIRRSSIIPINRDGSPHGYRLRVRVDVHSELFSLTYIFDRIDTARRGVLPRQIAKLPGDPSATGWLFNGLWGEASDSAEKDAMSKEPAGKVPAARIIAPWLHEADGSDAPNRLGTLITDFRGIIICPDHKWKVDEPSLDKATLRKLPGRRPRLDEVLAEFADTHKRLIRRVADPGAPEAGGKAESAAGAPKSGRDVGGEAVVCGMLDGKALYAASLGEWGKGSPAPHPIRHLLVYSGHSAAQLGRLVRRMQVLGELRHAALLDYDPYPNEGPAPASRPGDRPKISLRDAGRRISALSRELARATTKAGTPMASLQSIVATMAQISEDVDGGLIYRVEQSRYYAHELQRAITHLRLVRVGDWQPYDDFVQRYILHLFARVDRIGNRYEALGRKVDRLLFVKQAELLDSYTKSVNRTVREIDSATTALNASALEQIRASEKQVSLLEDAELFAAVFLIYYVGSVFYHFLEAGERGHSPGGEVFLLGWAILIGLLGGPLFVVVMCRWIIGKIRKWRHRPAPRIEAEPQPLLPLVGAPDSGET